MEALKNGKTRNYGIDIVKITAMFLVVLFHVVGCGIGTQWKTGELTVRSLAFGFLEAISLMCIDLFALSTGYLYSEKKNTKYSKIISLWIQVVFWSVVPIIFMGVYKKDISVLSGIPTGFMVVSLNRYWYFCAYLILFLLIPFINKFICSLKSKQLFAVVLGFGILFSVDSFFGQSSFAMTEGHTFVWLAYMYIVGAAIRKWENKLRTKTVLLIILFVGSLICEGILIALGEKYPLYHDFIGYNYIFVSFPSFLLFLCMIKIKINGTGKQKVCKTLSGASFAVYLSHLNPLIYENFIHNKFLFVEEYSTAKAIFATIGIAMIIGLIGTVLGIIQVEVFKLIKVDKFSEWLEIIIRKAYNTIYQKITTLQLKK